MAIKCTLTLRERGNLKAIIEQPRLGGGTTMKDIRKNLALIDKLEYDGDKDDPTLKTELKLEPWEIKRIHQRASEFGGWPVAEWVADMQERLDEYKNQLDE